VWIDPETNNPDQPDDPSPDRPTTVRPRASWASTAILALLMVGTSWAVASWVSEWLVPPYLILMALLLFPSTGRPPGDPASDGSDLSESSRPSSTVEGPDDLDSPPDGRDSPGSPEEGSEPATSSKPVKARRGKGRAKKVKPAPEPTEATWIQVAPGKFVRVEAADESQGPAGPHSPVGEPVEVPATPQGWLFEGDAASGRSEDQVDDAAPPGASSDTGSEDPTEPTSPIEAPIEEPEAAFDSIEGPEVDLTEEVESATSADFEEESEPGESPEDREETADGLAPEAEESQEIFEATSPDALSEEAVEEEPGVDLEEGFSVEDDSTSWAEDPEHDRPVAGAEAMTEDPDDWEENIEGTDPTETTVDETDFDDAGPSEVEAHEIESLESPDLDTTEPLPNPSGGPSRWPGGLVPRAWTPVGHAPSRSIPRTTPPGRSPRSRRGVRRPSDPRRFSRRGLARPRQNRRTFPPRSPPGGRIGREGA